MNKKIAVPMNAFGLSLFKCPMNAFLDEYSYLNGKDNWLNVWLHNEFKGKHIKTYARFEGYGLLY
jgi:hypothetical protein